MPHKVNAVFYYEKSLDRDNYSEIDASLRLIEIANHTNNEKLLSKYAPLYAEKSSEKIQNNHLKTELSSLYNEYITEKESLAKRHKTRLIFISLSLTAFIILSISTFINVKRKKTIASKEHYIKSLQGKIKKKDKIINNKFSPS